MTQPTVATLPWGEWTPDLSPLNRGAGLARNVVADQDGYRPMPQPVPIGPSGLPVGVTAVAQFTSPAGLAYTFAGTKTGLYRATRIGWEPVTRASGPYQSVTRWKFARFGSVVYAVNGRDVIQRFDLEASPTFENVPGITFGARYIAVIRRFLTIAYVVDDEGNTLFPYTVRWAGLGRPEDWTPSARTQADMQDVPAVGEITGITGGEWGTVLGRQGWQRQDFVGPPERMAFRVLEEDVGGCDVPGSVLKVGNRSIWLGQHGWRMSQGGPSVPIGLGRVDQHIRRRLALDTTMQATILPQERAALWSYRSRDAVGDSNDEVLCWAWEAGPTGRWTDGRMKLDALGQASLAASFTDDPDHAAQFTDSDAWAERLTDDASLDGGAPFPAAIYNSTLQALQMTDSNVAQIETGEHALVPGMRSRLLRARPLVDGFAGSGEIELEVYTRDDQAESPVGGRRYKREPTGSYSIRRTGRFHRIRAVIQGLFERALGVQIAPPPSMGSR